MPRVARVVVAGVPHHITQRGSNRQDVFFTDDDRHLYIALLRKQCALYGAAVSAYCLMMNHVHLVLTPNRTDSLARAVGRTHWLYSQAINRLHGRSGHLWQNRFHSCAMEPAHELAAARYVERNPVRARMVRVPWRYTWSSAKAHCGRSGDDSGLPDLKAWSKRWPAAVWQGILRDPTDGQFATRLLAATSRGRPLGSDRFIAKLESRLNRRLHPMPNGRPRKEKNT